MTEKDELEQFLRHIVSQDREKDRTADKIAQQENEPDFPQKGASGSFFAVSRNRREAATAGTVYTNSRTACGAHIFLTKNLYETRRIVAFLRQF